MAGIDLERVVHRAMLESQLRELVCPLCLDLVKPSSGRQAPCGHLFCSSCIIKSLEAVGPTCPIDKKAVSEESLEWIRDANPMIYRMLGSIKVKCTNFDKGCAWIGDASEEDSHLQKCLQQQRHCPCCSEKDLDLDRAVKLISVYRQLVGEYQEKLTNIHSLCNQKYQLAMDEQNRKLESVKQRLNELSAQIPEEIDSLSQLNLNRSGTASTAGSRHVPTPSSSPTRRNGPSKSDAALPLQPWKAPVLVATLKDVPERVTCLASFYNSVFASYASGTISMWNRKSNVCTWNDHKALVNKIVVQPDGTIFSCGNDNVVRVWSRATGSGTVDDSVSSSGHTPVAMAAVKDVLYVGYRKGGICLFKGNQYHATIREHGAGSLNVDIVASEDGVVYFSGSLEGEIMSFRGVEFVKALKGHTAEVCCLTVGPSGVLYSLAVDGCIKMWANQSCVRTLVGFHASRAIVVGDDGVIYADHPAENAVRAWKLGECVATFEGHDSPVTAMAITPNGLLYSGDARGSIKIWKGSL